MVLARAALVAIGVAVGVASPPPTPHYLLSCPKPKALQTKCMTKDGYDWVSGLVRAQLDALPGTCNVTECPKADYAGCVLRMAGHDFMDFNVNKGGSDACTNMEHPDNAGLAACLVAGEFGKSLQDVYSKVCHWMSLADLLVVAAEAVMTEARDRVVAIPSQPNLNPQTIDFKPSFRFGRKTAKTCPEANGLLPNPEDGCDAVEAVFVRRMGLSWDAAAALMGVHTLGRAQVSNSGYQGWWSDPENSRRFNNNYYAMMFIAGWVPEQKVNGNLNKNQWKRSDKGKEKPGQRHHMMLNTDLCFAYTDGRKYTEIGKPVKSADTDCCAWVGSRLVLEAITDNDMFYCGTEGRTDERRFRNAARKERKLCCGEEGLPIEGEAELAQSTGAPYAIDCGNFFRPEGPAARAMLRYANNEAAWLEAFEAAWTKATENGFTDCLKPLQDTCY